MPPLVRIVVIAAVVLVSLGVIVYLLADPSPPIERIEQVVPNERFSR